MTDRDYQDLLESEGRHRAFMDHGPVLAFMKDDQLRYVYMNPHMERTFGITLDDLRGKADVDWLPRNTAQSVQVNDRRVLDSGEQVETIEELPTADGRVGHWLVLKFPFTGTGGRRFVGGVGIDVTGLEVARALLAESERRYRHLVESAQGLICTHDLSGRLLTVNRAAREALGYTEAEMIGADMRDLLGPDATGLIDRYLERIDHVGSDAGVLFLKAKDGRELAWQYHNVKVTDAGQAPYVLGHAQNVTELREAQERLRELTMTDDLTDLHNRRGFFAHGARLLQSAQQHHQALALVYADVDGLKRVNDTYGHDVGSALIVSASEVLKQTFRAADVVARVGGDEFAALAAISRDDVSLISSRLALHLRNYNQRANAPCPLSLSVGIAHLDPGSSITLEELMRQADVDMYATKRRQGSLRR